MRQAHEFSPEVAIVDLMLPGISGSEVIQRLSAFPKPVLSCLATGMADFALLKRALTEGAWSLLGKPFRLAHLAELLHSMAVMVSAREQLSSLSEDSPSDCLKITRRGDTPVTGEDIARVMQFALRNGADDDTARRRLPIVVYALLLNAQTHGAKESGDNWYRLLLGHDQTELSIQVADSGKGFAWQKEMSRVRSSWDHSKAKGLQLVTALCDEIQFGGDEFTAATSLTKTAKLEKPRAEASRCKY